MMGLKKEEYKKDCWIFVKAKDSTFQEKKQSTE